jgi:hypothetical protein
MRAMTKTIVRIHERLQRIEARVSKRREISDSPDDLPTEDEEDEPS